VSTETIARSQLDADLSLFASSRADLGAFRAQIGRKIVRAPFTGRLGIRAVNLGQYVSPGATITVLEDIDTVFADFSLPQRQLESVAIGMPISLVIDGADGPQGSVAAIEPAIDASTRMMKLRASVPNQDHKLRPGMFVRVSVALPGKEEVVTVPATAIIHAPYGDSVFVLEDKPGAKTKDDKQIKIARQRFVRMGESRGDFVSIASGLDAGLEVVTAGGFKLRNNAAVVVNNDVRATPEESPRPQNR
jgi:membrane fusion protein (multidrug efflux system)